MLFTEIIALFFDAYCFLIIPAFLEELVKSSEGIFSFGISPKNENPQVEEWRMISKTIGKRCFLKLENAQDISKDVQYMSFNYILGIRTVKDKLYFAKSLKSLQQLI